MIRVYGGTVTEGLTDGVEVGTAENPILFDGLYPAPNGEAVKTLTFAIRTDGETLKDVCVIVAMLDQAGKDLDVSGAIYRYGISNYSRFSFFYTKGEIFCINPQTLLFKEVNAANQIFYIQAKAMGTEAGPSLPDLRGKLHIIPVANIWIKSE